MIWIWDKYYLQFGYSVSVWSLNFTLILAIDSLFKFVHLNSFVLD